MLLPFTYFLLGNLKDFDMSQINEFPACFRQLLCNIVHAKRRPGTNLFGNGAGKMFILHLAQNLFGSGDNFQWNILLSTTTHSKNDLVWISIRRRQG